MVKVPRSGTVLRRLLALAIVRMSSMVRSNCRVPLFQVLIMRMQSQRRTRMDLQLLRRSVPPARLRLALKQSGGPTVMDKAPRNGMASKRLLVSATARTNSTRRSGFKATLFQALIMRMPSPALIQWASPSFKKKFHPRTTLSKEMNQIMRDSG